MIWDTHGQLLAMSGASMLQSLNFLKDVIAPAFDGSTKMPSSFFLYEHVSTYSYSTWDGYDYVGAYL